MSPQTVKRLREALSCSVGELAAAVGTDVKTVMAWEAGDLFPTKRHVSRLAALEEAGPSAIPKKSRSKATGTGVGVLGEPRLWTIVRKLTAHPNLLREVEKLADAYDDPAPPPKS